MITTLSQLIAHTESNNRLNAIRFEPAYHPAQVNILACIASQKPVTMTYNTAEIMCACSWGKYQIMGDNLFALGMKQSLGEFWGSETLQDTMFTRYCENRKINYTLEQVLNDETTRKNFARRYNGSELYAIRMMNIYNQLTTQKGN